MSTDPHITRCAWCGDWMLSKRKRRKPQYCTKACRQMAEVRHPETRRETRTVPVRDDLL